MIPCDQCGERHPDRFKICPVTGNLFAPDRFFSRGTVIEGKYRLDRFIGADQAAMFQATHTLLNKKVAVKILFLDADVEQTSKQLIKEARAVSATGHPTIVAITDLGITADEALFIVMEHVQGLTLAELVQQQGPVSEPRAAGIICEILAGLTAVAKKGIIHRDLKPSNVLLVDEGAGEQKVKIMDFCVGRVIQGDLSRDRPAGRSRTLLYMAPELLDGQDASDQRVDIYSCGAILYHLLTGRPPYAAADRAQLITQILGREVPPPSDLVPSISSTMDRVVLRALSRDRDRRFTTAAEFRRALEPHLSEEEGDEDLEWSPPQLSTGTNNTARRGVTKPSTEKPLLASTVLAPSVSMNRRVGKPSPRAAPDLDLKISTNPMDSADGGSSEEISLELTSPDSAIVEPDAGQGVDLDLDASLVGLDSIDAKNLEPGALALEPEQPDRGPRSKASAAKSEPEALGGGLLALDELDEDRLELDDLGGGLELGSLDETPEPPPQRSPKRDSHRAPAGGGRGAARNASSEIVDPFAPADDEGATALSALQLAEVTIEPVGEMAPRESGSQLSSEGKTGAPAVRGSAAMYEELETEFHRAAMWVLLVCLLAGAALAAWPQRYQLWTYVSGDWSVMKMLDLKTDPPNAAVYIDGELQSGRPLRFEGDKKEIRVRVQAEGHRSKRIKVKADIRETLKIKLDRR